MEKEAKEVNHLDPMEMVTERRERKKMGMGTPVDLNKSVKNKKSDEGLDDNSCKTELVEVAL